MWFDQRFVITKYHISYWEFTGLGSTLNDCYSNRRRGEHERQIVNAASTTDVYQTLVIDWLAYVKIFCIHIS